jgi:hypothetical protein
VVERVPFQPEPDGTWERLPGGLLERIRADAPDLIV